MMQNLGFSNFVIGRDHAGVKNFYGKYESQKLGTVVNNLKVDGQKVNTEIDNTIMKFTSCFQSKKLRKIISEFIEF